MEWWYWKYFFPNYGRHICLRFSPEWWCFCFLVLSYIGFVHQFVWHYSISFILKNISTCSVCLIWALKQRILGEYTSWLKENNIREGMQYKETFEKRWPLLVDSHEVEFTTNYLSREVDIQSVRSIEKFSAAAASKWLDQEIREVVSPVLHWINIYLILHIERMIKCSSFTLNPYHLSHFKIKNEEINITMYDLCQKAWWGYAPTQRQREKFKLWGRIT